MLPNKVQFEGQGSGQAGQPDLSPATPPVQPEATPQSSQVGQPAGTPDGFTPTQLKQLSELIAQTSEQLRRQQQSETAKAEKRIKDQVASQLKVMRDAGMQVVPETEQAVERIVRKQMTDQTDAPQDGTPAQVQPQGQPGEGQISAIDAAAYAMMDAVGIDIEPTDPEANSLDRSSPQAFLTSVHKALLAKQARVSTSPSARIPAGSGGAPATNALPDDPDTLWKMARAQTAGRR